jgi:hypothetical protein
MTVPEELAAGVGSLLLHDAIRPKASVIIATESLREVLSFIIVVF